MSPGAARSHTDHSVKDTMFCCVPSLPVQKRIKIDPLSIGAPTGFRHVAHVGSDMLTSSTAALTENLEEQEFPIHLKLMDLPITPECKSVSSNGDSNMTNLGEHSVDQPSTANSPINDEIIIRQRVTTSKYLPTAEHEAGLPETPQVQLPSYTPKSNIPCSVLPGYSDSCPTSGQRFPTPSFPKRFSTRLSTCPLDIDPSKLPPPPPPPTYQRYLRVSSTYASS